MFSVERSRGHFGAPVLAQVDDRQVGRRWVRGLQDPREPAVGHGVPGVGLLRPLHRGQADRPAQNRFQPAHSAGENFV